MKTSVVYENKNSLNNYLRTKFGERFFIISDSYSKFIGLFDYNFLASGSMMSNSEVEKSKNLKIIEVAKGDVLIAGLGIGLIVLPIMNKPEVKSIDIIELQKEVIDLIAPQLPLNEKVKIINGDISSFIPERKYDVIYLDTMEPISLTESEKIQRTRDGVFLDDRKLVKIFEKYLKENGQILTF